MKKKNLSGAIEKAIEIAERNEELLTIGIEATHPSTRFGYIKYSKNNDNSSYYDVIKFKEKPILEKAIEFIESKDYAWNSGMLFGKIETILNSFQRYMPNMYKHIECLDKSIGTSSEIDKIEKIYDEVESISIDKGILEKSDSTKMIKANFIWNDVGDLKEIFNVKEPDSNSNTVFGNCIIDETKNTNIYNGEDGIIVTLGVSNLSVIKNNNVCLVCSNEQISKIPDIYKKLKEMGTQKRFL